MDISNSLNNNTAAGYGATHAMKGEQQRLAGLRADYLNPKDKTHKEMRDTAQQFEAIFVKQLLDEMEKTIDREDSLLGGGSAEGYFRDMMYENIANNMSTGVGGSGLGIAEMVYRQMEQQQLAQKLPQQILENGDVDKNSTNEVKE